MYKIRRLKDFEKSVKRLRKSGADESVFRKLEQTIDLLASGQTLPASYRDHPLRGELKDRRECHIKNDVLLVYRIDKDNLILILADVGGHSYLF